MSARQADHPDRRGVFIELWVIDLCGGDYPAALLLSQLLWWFQPSLRGEPRIGYVRDGHRWLVRADDEWWDECRLTTVQVRRVRKVLADAGLIATARFKKNGAPTSAWRPDLDRITEVCPEPPADAAEDPSPNCAISEVQDFRTSLRTALPTAPATALPIPLKTNKKREVSQLHGDATRLCDLMADLIGARPEAKRPTVTDGWRKDMDRLLRIDGREPAQIEHVIRWLDKGADPVSLFWQPNIRSPRKLREKWDQMADQYRAHKAADTRPRTARESRRDLEEAMING